MLASTLGGLVSWSKLTGSNNDDSLDRMSHIYTVAILVIFSVVVSTGSYVGDPIHCWVPGELDKGHYVNYLTSYCWVSNTYHIPLHEKIPEKKEHRNTNVIVYYQWIPIILLFQAFLFKLPNIFWQMFNSGNGMNLDKIVNLAEKTQLGSQKDRTETIDYIGDYMDKWIAANREYRYNIYVRVRRKLNTIFCLLCSKRDGTYLTGLYLVTKCLYAANAIGQFFLLNAFLAQKYHLYGFEVMSYLKSHGAIIESPLFPRTTYCDITIRQLSNKLPFTMQCVLPINLFNEKIFIFMWFWLVLVSTLTCISLLSWLYRVLVGESYVQYIFKYLKLNEEALSKTDKHLCKRFASEYLRRDGVFVMRVVGKNSTDLVVSDLVNYLWKIYKSKEVLPVKDTIMETPMNYKVMP